LPLSAAFSLDAAGGGFGCSAERNFLAELNRDFTNCGTSRDLNQSVTVMTLEKPTRDLQRRSQEKTGLSQVLIKTTQTTIFRKYPVLDSNVVLAELTRRAMFSIVRRPTTISQPARRRTNARVPCVHTK
jgi:hypothetical protein